MLFTADCLLPPADVGCGRGAEPRGRDGLGTTRLVVVLIVSAAVLAVWLCPLSTRADGKGPSKREEKLRAAAALKANKRCYECHIDFEEEELSTTHQSKGVTCVRCHGHSQPHIDDEVRATPPDAVFRAKTMKVFCLTCHTAEEHIKVKTHALEAARATKTGKPERTCTACHGEHELVDTEAVKPAKKK